jgi:hypothetical protein
VKETNGRRRSGASKRLIRLWTSSYLPRRHSGVYEHSSDLLEHLGRQRHRVAVTVDGSIQTAAGKKTLAYCVVRMHNAREDRCTENRQVRWVRCDRLHYSANVLVMALTNRTVSESKGSHRAISSDSNSRLDRWFLRVRLPGARRTCDFHWVSYGTLNFGWRAGLMWIHSISIDVELKIVLLSNLNAQRVPCVDYIEL